MQPQEALSSTPSLRRVSFDGSPQEIPAVEPIYGGLDEAAAPVEGGGEGREDDDGGSEDFEFAVVARESYDSFEPISADEIFSDGQIRPIYPLFSRALLLDDVEPRCQDREGGPHGGNGKPPRLPLGKLMMEDRDAPSTSSSVASSESDDLEGVPADMYCVWTPGSVPPSPELRKRSHSTGDSSKRWRLRDLVIGRSQSDGRKKFVFLAAPHSSPAETGEKTGKKPPGDEPPAAAKPGEEQRKVKGKGRSGRKVMEMDMVTAHRLYYGKGGAATGDRRRSYLPYRPDLVGIFTNVNGAGRGFQPL